MKKRTRKEAKEGNITTSEMRQGRKGIGEIGGQIYRNLPRSICLSAPVRERERERVSVSGCTNLALIVYRPINLPHLCAVQRRWPFGRWLWDCYGSAAGPPPPPPPVGRTEWPCAAAPESPDWIARWNASSGPVAAASAAAVGAAPSPTS